MKNENSYEFSTNLARIDWTAVHGWLASSYWTPDISMERVKRAAEHSSMVLGAYETGRQVGYLRVVSDKTRFAYLCDVWVDKASRGNGLATKMVQFAMNHPDFATVNWLLATLDAHPVYAKLGFTPLHEPIRWMSKGTFSSR